MDNSQVKKTALFQRHEALGAKMVPFAGYRMPLSYAGQLDEHHAVRRGLGLFDLSHMGEFRLRGEQALAAVDRLVTNRVADIPVGQAVYSPMCRDDGGIVDDLIVYHLRDSVLMVVNASNIDKDAAWVRDHLLPGVTFADESDDTSLLAVQGPRAGAFVARLTSSPVAALDTYTALEGEVAGVPALISRTGYTGEDGFELYVANGRAPELWDRLLEEGKADGIVPVGLAARDTLRFEMGYCLYGNDIDETTTPLEAGLGWTVKLKKPEFVGRDALVAQKERGPSRRLVGLEPEGARAIPRGGYQLFAGDTPVGSVTSGTFAPSLDRGLAMGYVKADHARRDAEVEVDIRGRRVPARVRRLPFYTEGSRKAPPKKTKT